MTNITEQTLRLKTGETVAQLETYYGNHLVYQPYEDGIDDYVMRVFEVNPNLPKVPTDLWNKLMTLFLDYAEQDLEVHARIIYDEYRNDWKVIIPTQMVTGGSATYNYQSCVDLETGRSLSYPADLPSYDNIWHIHSHNTMQLKHPSGVDDKDELHVKQGYCVISNIDLVNRTYKWCFTVVGNDGKNKQNKRFFLPDSAISEIVSDISFNADVAMIVETDYHNNVHQVISRYVVQPSTEHWYSWLPKGSKKKTVVNYYDYGFELFDTRSFSTWGVEDEMRYLVKEFGLDEVKAALAKLEKEGIV
jgi:hypothetical protein